MPRDAMPDCPDIKKCLSGRQNHPDLANTWGRAAAQGLVRLQHNASKVNVVGRCLPPPCHSCKGKLQVAVGKRKVGGDEEGFRTALTARQPDDPIPSQASRAQEKAGLELQVYPEPERRNCRCNSTNDPRWAAAGLTYRCQDYEPIC